jgi:ribosomal protein L7/L12
MDRLKDDIDERARNFEYIEYYDASLRDRLAKDLVSAGDNQDQLDDRRRPLASINPLYAQASVLPPSPSVDDSVSEQLSLNVAQYAANTLTELDENDQSGNVVEPQGETKQTSEHEMTSDTSNDNTFNDDDQIEENIHPEDVPESDVPESDVPESDVPESDVPDTRKSYSVILMSAGPAKLQVVKIIKETFDLGLSDAKELVESAPTPVIQNLSREEAEELKKVIEATGAEVDLMEE